jgi:hypothetical protein
VAQADLTTGETHIPGYIHSIHASVAHTLLSQTLGAQTGLIATVVTVFAQIMRVIFIRILMAYALAALQALLGIFVRVLFWVCVNCGGDIWNAINRVSRMQVPMCTHIRHPRLGAYGVGTNGLSGVRVERVLRWRLVLELQGL